MADLVSVVALSHAPGLTGWLDQAPEHEQKSLVAGFTKLGEILRAAKPDLIIGLANDHLLNMPLHDLHDFCIGTAGAWKGPAEWFRDWVNVPYYEVGGNAAASKAIHKGLTARGFDMVAKEDLLFDDNWSVPLFYLTPDYDVPLVPIHMNCIVPPVPDPKKCYAMGAAIAEIVRNDLPSGMRVAIMGTGGLSHDPGGPKYFSVDEKFDRWFMDLLGTGDPDRVLRECTLEKMVDAGDGGTSELIAWIAAMGAAGARKAHNVCYEPSVELRCGMGCMYWDMAEAPVKETVNA
jgi:aromatic ring-opening dioxygenase catalytic subunit (LigB family)